MDEHETWTDASVFGSPYEQQVSSRGRWRHRDGTHRLRSQAFAERGRHLTIEPHEEDAPWRSGPAPS